MNINRIQQTMLKMARDYLTLTRDGEPVGGVTVTEPKPPSDWIARTAEQLKKTPRVTRAPQSYYAEWNNMSEAKRREIQAKGMDAADKPVYEVSAGPYAMLRPLYNPGNPWRQMNPTSPVEEPQHNPEDAGPHTALLRKGAPPMPAPAKPAEVADEAASPQSLTDGLGAQRLVKHINRAVPGYTAGQEKLLAVNK